MFPNDTDLLDAEDLEREAADAIHRARTQARKLESQARDAIRTHPLSAVGLAVGAGVLVARIGRRRTYPLAVAALGIGTRFIVAAVAERLLAAASARIQNPR